ncbi:MAG TPA: hypothetical protein VMP68_31370 [Candidatus Eisenbacteria bacterium]|nr:hypothetical protein [Candidatus Eisenbacteria bacterium]
MDMLDGFGFLKEMSREELTEELIGYTRERLTELSIENLRANVIDKRVERYKQRLAAEAGLETTFLGYRISDDEG